MKQGFSAVVACVLCVLVSVEAKNSAPEVQVYSREPGDFNKLNTLICYVRNFHPPEIRIELLKNGQEIREARQTDLAFEENWHYHLTKHVPFIPKSEDKYTCRVTHMGNTKIYEWEPDM